MNWAASLGPEGLTKEAKVRLETGQFQFRLYHGRQEEEAEDVLAELLRISDLDPALRQAIVAACDAVATKIWEGLPHLVTDAESQFEALLKRWADLIDVSKPCEMRSRSTGLLQAALEMDPINPKLLGRLARAAQTFKLTAVDLPVWEKLLTIPQTAALAFRSIKKIDPEHPRVLGHLETLLHHFLVDQWPIAVGSLIDDILDESEDVSRLSRFLLEPSILVALAKATPGYQPTPKSIPHWNKVTGTTHLVAEFGEMETGINPFDLRSLFESLYRISIKLLYHRTRFGDSIFPGATSIWRDAGSEVSDEYAVLADIVSSYMGKATIQIDKSDHTVTSLPTSHSHWCLIDAGSREPWWTVPASGVEEPARKSKQHSSRWLTENPPCFISEKRGTLTDSQYASLLQTIVSLNPDFVMNLKGDYLRDLSGIPQENAPSSRLHLPIHEGFHFHSIDSVRGVPLFQIALHSEKSKPDSNVFSDYSNFRSKGYLNVRSSTGFQSSPSEYYKHYAPGESAI